MNTVTSENNYIYMLIGLLCLTILPTVSGTFLPIITEISTHIGFLFVMFIGIWSINRNTPSFKICCVLALLGLVFSVLQFFVLSVVPELLALMCVLIFCTISTIVAMKHVMFSGKVTSNKIVGSICIYLLIGVIWGALYNILVYFEPQAFHGLSLEHAANGGFLYFSFVTLTTLGYGDISPAIPLTRSLAYMEAIVGQFYLTILVASLVASYLNQRKEN